MPLRTCLMRTCRPFGSVFGLPWSSGPLPGATTNVRGHVRPPPSTCARDRVAAGLRRASTPRSRAICSTVVSCCSPSMRRAHHVVRIRRAEALRENVGDAGALHDRAHRAAGDHAGARRGGLHQHRPAPCSPTISCGIVPPVSGMLDHVATRGIDGLAHRLRHFVRLARREADLALTVAHGDERVEREAPAALHDLRDAVDRDRRSRRDRCPRRSPPRPPPDRRDRHGHPAAATAARPPRPPRRRPDRHDRHRDHRGPPPPGPPRHAAAGTTASRAAAARRHDRHRRHRRAAAATARRATARPVPRVARRSRF